MRIGIFTESYEPIVNGVSVFVTTLRDELTRQGHEVYVFAPRFRKYTDNYDKVFRLPSTHTILMPDYPFPIPIAAKHRKAFADLHLDIVHTQTPFILGILGAKWAREFGVPLVSTNHTIYTEYVHYVPVRPKTLTRSFLINLMKWYYSRCDAVVVPSNPVRKMLESYGINKRIETIRTGVVSAKPSDTATRDRIRESFGIGPDDQMILYVGRIAREKNLRMLINAMKIVGERNGHAKLIVVGGGPASVETIQYAQQMGVSERVEFVGMQPREKIDPIYAAADVFVFPSTTETQGIAICEALSAGLPVVAVNAGGIPENVQEGSDGFLTQNDEHEFAQRIEELVRNEELRKTMGQKARQNAADFSIERMAREFECFYQSVIDGKANA